MTAAVGTLSRSAPELRPVVRIIGFMLAALAAAMLVPAAVDALAGDEDWQTFVASAACTLAAALATLRLSRCHLSGGLTIRQAFLLTPLSWLATSAFAAVPFFFSRDALLGGNWTNAVFEAVSGITTTGATVMVGLDAAPVGVLLWRALLQWMGGIGIIAVAIAILPALRIGGMQLFRTESSDRSEKVMPRAQQIAVAITIVYVSLTIACAFAYWLAGMRVFDSAAHAMTTIATSGFSTSDASLGKWNDAAVHWIAIVFMIAGSLPFVLYVRALRPGRTGPWLDSQARTFLAFVATATFLMWVWLAGAVGYAPGDAILHAAFSIVSVVTTTGFATEDYSRWGNTAIGVFFALMFIGGCTGSTAGGIKVFRYEVVAVMLRSHFLHLLYPRGVFPRVYAGRLLPDDVVGSVVVFFALFFASYAVLTIGLMTFGLDFLTSASGAVAALANIGPGLGDIIGPSGNFSRLPDGAKWLLAFGMLLGRLELFTVVILFMPQFWRG